MRPGGRIDVRKTSQTDVRPVSLIGHVTLAVDKTRVRLDAIQNSQLHSDTWQTRHNTEQSATLRHVSDYTEYSTITQVHVRLSG